MEFGDIIQRLEGRPPPGENMTELYIQFKPLQQQEGLSVVFLLALSISCLIGVVGNSMVIGAVIVYKKLRTVGNMFIVNLAIADLIVVTIVEPFNMVGILIGPRFFIHNTWICHVVSVVCVMACVCSMMNLAAIAINRYILITKSHLYTQIYTRRTTFIICILLWFVAFLVELPNLTGWSRHAFDLKTFGCSFDRLMSLPYTIFLGAVALWIPLCVVLYCYVKIYIRVTGIKKQLLKISIYSKKDKKRSRRLQENANLALTFFIVFMSFLICWAPYDLLILIDRSDAGPHWIYIIFLQIGHFNSSLNSIIYGLTNTRFRDGYKSLFRKIFRREKEESFEEGEKRSTDRDISTDGNLSSGLL